MSTPFATIKAYRRKGGAVVTIEHQGRPPRRYCVTLKRYHALRTWAIRQRRWKTSGAWMKSSLAVSLWTADPGARNDFLPTATPRTEVTRP